MSSVLSRQVVAGHKSVGRVDTDPHPRAPRNHTQRLEGRAELGTGPDGVLDHRFGRCSVEFGGPLSRPPQAFDEPLHTLRFAVPPVAARVHDYQVDPEGTGGGKLARQGHNGEVALLLLSGSEVYE